MRDCIVLCLAAASVVLTGCNQPAVTLKPPAAQSSENTIRDWNDVAHTIVAGMTARGLLPSPQTVATTTVTTTRQQQLPNGFMSDTWRTEQTAPFVRPIFIRVQAPDSAFVRQVASELEADILDRGVPVARRPDGATVVNLDVNFVRWGPRDKPPGLIGTASAVAAIPGLVLGASAPMSLWTATDAAASTTGGFGILSDLIVAATPTMNAEAVWEATIVTNDAVVMKLQQPIYIRAPDIPLYAKDTSLAPVSSWSNNAPLAGRPIPFNQ